MTELECPKCNHEFEARDWENSNCPVCDNEYWFEEECTADYSDCWMAIYWENYK